MSSFEKRGEWLGKGRRWAHLAEAWVLGERKTGLIDAEGGRRWKNCSSLECAGTSGAAALRGKTRHFLTSEKQLVVENSTALPPQEQSHGGIWGPSRCWLSLRGEAPRDTSALSKKTFPPWKRLSWPGEQPRLPASAPPGGLRWALPGSWREASRHISRALERGECLAQGHGILRLPPLLRARLKQDRRVARPWLGACKPLRLFFFPTLRSFWKPSASPRDTLRLCFSARWVSQLGRRGEWMGNLGSWGAHLGLWRMGDYHMNLRSFFRGRAIRAGLR